MCQPMWSKFKELNTADNEQEKKKRTQSTIRNSHPHIPRGSCCVYTYMQYIKYILLKKKTPTKFPCSTRTISPVKNRNNPMILSTVTRAILELK